MKPSSYYRGRATKALLALSLCTTQWLAAQSFTFPTGSVVDIVAETATLAANLRVIPNDGINDQPGIQDIFRRYQTTNRILYLRDGTYDLGDSISFVGDRRFNILHGQSRDGTILRLMNNLPAFATTEKAVFNIDGAGSADRFQNEIYALTINTGTGNPAATGISFIANNQGGLRDVRIISTNTSSIGTGLNLSVGLNGPLMVKRVRVEGFRYGIRCGNAGNSNVMDDITLINQINAGIFNIQQAITVSRLASQQNRSIPAIINGNGNTAQEWFSVMTLVDSSLVCTATPVPDHAIICRGAVSAANVSITGYNFAARQLYMEGVGLAASNLALQGPGIVEWVKRFRTIGQTDLTVGATSTANPLRHAQFAPAALATLPDQEILDTPELPWANPNDPTKPNDQWVNVRDFGALGNDTTDDTTAFQNAINSMKTGGTNAGKTTLYIPPSPNLVSPPPPNLPADAVAPSKPYLIQGTVDVNGPVRRIIGLKGNLRSSLTGRFVVNDSGTGNAPVVRIERLNCFGPGNTFTVEHASNKRTVAVVNSRVRLFGNGAGDFFAEDVNAPVHSFVKPFQRVYARQLNAENQGTKITNSGAMLYVLGLKSEKFGALVDTTNGGFTQVNGGFAYRVDSTGSNSDPMFSVSNGSAVIFGVVEYDATPGMLNFYDNLVRETRGTAPAKTWTRANNGFSAHNNGSQMLNFHSAAAADIPTPWTIWYRGQFGATATPNETANGDGDTMNNLLEYALGSDPLVNDNTARAPKSVAQGGRRRFLYSRPTQGRTDCVYTAEFSTSSTGPWSPIPGTVTQTVNLATGLTDVNHNVGPNSTTPSNFYRLRITLQ
jgi:hypothetical protein